MKIVVCGSSSFRKEVTEFRDRLKAMGHEAIVNPIYDDWAQGKRQELWEQVQKDHASVKREHNFIKWYYNAIVNSDAILVVNLNKNGSENYIGGNVLMEIGFAHVHDKKIFLLNPAPEVGYKDEILAVSPVVLNGDLSKIGGSA